MSLDVTPLSDTELSDTELSDTELSVTELSVTELTHPGCRLPDAPQLPGADRFSPASAADELRTRLGRYSCYETTPDDAMALFAEARDRCPVPFSEKLGGFHMLTRWADVRRAHLEPDTFASGPSVLRPLAPRPRFPPIEFDKPEHTPWRNLFAQALNSRTPRLIEQRVLADVGQLLDAITPRGSCDLVADLAEPVALFALCHVLGFDTAKRDEVRRHTVDMHASAGDPERGAAAFMAFAAFGAAEVLARRSDPRDDYLTALAHAEIDGRPLTAEELGATMNSLLNAGHGTTVAGLSSTFYEVFSRPPVRRALLADPALVPAAIEESLRLHPPFFGLYRMTTCPVEINGKALGAGESLLLNWASANRDAAVFDAPDEFRLDRPAGHHLSFGFGRHGCMGRAMARMVMRIALEQLLTRLPGIELVEPETISHVFGGSETAVIRSLPAHFTPR